jgi:arylsulfatase
MTGISENAFLNVKNRSHSITAEVEIPKGGANGVILAQGGRFGGWSVYLMNGKPSYTYNFLGLEQTSVVAPQPLSAGKATLRLDFAYDGGGMGKGGTATLSVNGSNVADGRIPRTEAMVFSIDDPADVGIDDGTPVAAGLGERGKTRFTGRIAKVTVELK